MSIWTRILLSRWPQHAPAIPIISWKHEHPRTLGEYVPQSRLTREMERGTLKSLPPCSRKPQGAGPSSTTLKESMVSVPVRKGEINTANWQAGPDLITSVAQVPESTGGRSAHTGTGRQVSRRVWRGSWQADLTGNRQVLHPAPCYREGEESPHQARLLFSSRGGLWG